MPVCVSYECNAGNAGAQVDRGDRLCVEGPLVKVPEVDRDGLLLGVNNKEIGAIQRKKENKREKR